jgi:hypothetical protein
MPPPYDKSNPAGRPRDAANCGLFPAKIRREKHGTFEWFAEDVDSMSLFYKGFRKKGETFVQTFVPNF